MAARPPTLGAAGDPAGGGRRLRDVLAPGLRVLFVGINPSLASGRAGHHFAGPGNPFWRLLHASGFTPWLLRPEDDARLVELGLGVTNVCPRPTRSAAELTRREYEAGVRALLDKIDAFRPAVVALVGVTLARVVLPGSTEAGPGPRKAAIAGARVFVLPNPSGRNAAYPSFESKLAWFERLRELAGEEGAIRSRAATPVEKVISGGQTGVDRAALEAARAGGLARGGWCPPGRDSEAGPIPDELPLEATPLERSPDAPDVPRSQRTEWNVRDSDATLVLRPRAARGASPGTDWTERCAERHGRPLLVCDPADPGAASRVRAWLCALRVRTLNVAGPSEGEQPGIEERARGLLREVFGGEP